MDNKKELVEYYTRSFTNMRPSDKKIKDIEEIRDMFKVNMELIIDKCENMRELRLALTYLENSLMYAVKSIVLNDDN